MPPRPLKCEASHESPGAAYMANKQRVAAIIRIPNLKQETYGGDLSEMLQARLTFDEALETT